MGAPKFIKRVMAFRDRFRPWVILRTVISSHLGRERRYSKLCFFASHDPNSLLSPYVRLYLKELQSCGFDIVFCTTSPELKPESLAALTDVCHLVIHRRNIGHDFASWKACFKLLPTWRASEALLITNDSVLGPLYPLVRYFDKMDSSATPCWGMNDSHERAYHLQSFFIYLRYEALQSKRFARFWEGVSLLTEKYDIVKFYELGLSRALFKDDIAVDVLFSSEKVRAYCLSLGDKFQYPDAIRSPAFNASLYCAYELASAMAYPFVKADIIRNNRYRNRHYMELYAMLDGSLPEGRRGYFRPCLERVGGVDSCRAADVPR